MEENNQSEKQNPDQEQEFKVTKKQILVVIIVLIIIGFISSLGWWKGSPLEWFKGLKDRQRLVYKLTNENDEKQYDYLLEALEQAEDYPENFEPWVHIGRAKSYFKDYDGAIEAYNQANKNNPKNTLAWNNLGQLYLELKEYDKAEECFLTIIENHPTKDLQAYVELSYLYRKRIPGKEELADDILLQGLEANPNSGTLMSALASYYEEQGNYTEAIKWYEEMLKINPERQAVKDEIERLKKKL